MTEFKYPIDLTVSYTNDKEYRNEIRLLTGMKTSCNPTSTDEIDDISMDENDYDDVAMYSFIENIVNHTKDCYELQELYKLASATMFSLDASIGIVILFSFDYFLYFHQCLIVYFQNKDMDFHSNNAYNYLWNRLNKV